MNFYYPLFLIAALSVAVPIIIHLFNFRKYKRVFFPDIRFLKSLQEQTKRHSQLKKLLILASRILCLLALVLAFAQPFTQNEAALQKGPRAVSIYIDNSFSMGIGKASVSLLDQAREKAKTVIESCASSDRIQLLTNDFSLPESRFLTKEEALQQLGTITLSPRTREAGAIMEKQKRMLQTEPGKQPQLFFISDFQKNAFAADLETTDSIPKYFIQVQPAQTNNVTIDTAYLETPTVLLNQPNPLLVQVRNTGDEAVSTTLSLMVNDQLKSASSLSLKAGETKTEKISFTTATAGRQCMKIFLNDYPVNYDDTFYVAGKAGSNYAVLVINESGTNAYLSSVFRPGQQFRADQELASAVRIQLLKNYTLIILNGVNTLSPSLQQALSEYVESGSSLLVFPAPQSATGNINEFLNRLASSQYGPSDTNRMMVSDYNRSHLIFSDLFTKTPENIELPVCFRHYVIQSAALSSEQKLFTFPNGDAFLSEFRCGNGKLYLCASSADQSSGNFPKSYWFLPLIYKMAYLNVSNPVYALTIGKNAIMQIPNTKTGNENIYHVSDPSVDAIPEQRSTGNQVMLNLNQAIQKSGLYSVYLPGSSDTVFVGLNYNRNESELKYHQIDELKKNSKISKAHWSGDQVVMNAGWGQWQDGMPLWKVCIILALFFLLCESLLIRFMK